MEQYSPLMFDFKKLYLKLNTDGDKNVQMVLQGNVRKGSISLVRGKSLKTYNKEFAIRQIKHSFYSSYGGLTRK